MLCLKDNVFFTQCMWLKVCECLFHHWCAVKTLCMMTCFWFDLFSAPKLIIVARGIFKPIFTLTAMWGKLSNACVGVYCEHRGLWVTDSWVIPQSAHAGCYNKHTQVWDCQVEYATGWYHCEKVDVLAHARYIYLCWVVTPADFSDTVLMSLYIIYILH